MLQLNVKDVVERRGDSICRFYHYLLLDFCIPIEKKNISVVKKKNKLLFLKKKTSSFAFIFLQTGVLFLLLGS